MNDNTAKLLEQLANKLGTTSEYLWGVLLRQAPIAATRSIIELVLVIIFGFILYKVHVKLMKKPNNDRYEQSLYDKYEISAAVPMIVGLIIFAVLFIASMFDLSNNLNGYFNPEYWALQEVLSPLK